MTQYFLRALTQTQETLENSPDCGKPLKANSKKVKRRVNEEQCLSSCTWQPNRMFKMRSVSDSFPFLSQLWYYTKFTTPTLLSLVPLFNGIPMVPKNLDCLKPCFDKYSVTTNPKLLKKVQKHCSQHGFDRQVPTHAVEGDAHAQANFSNVTYIFSFRNGSLVRYGRLCDFDLALNPNLDCLVDYEKRERTGCRDTNDGVCNFMGSPLIPGLPQVGINSLGPSPFDYNLRANTPVVKATAICALAKMIQFFSFVFSLSNLSIPTSWPEFSSPPTCDHFMPNIFDEQLCSCVGTCASKIDFDPTIDKDPNLILHFHTDLGLWDCQETCKNTDGCEFYTHSKVNYFQEQDKYREDPVSPVFHCFLWRNCTKFFIPQQQEWLDLRSGPRDCSVYNQNCPIVFDANGALPSDKLPDTYTQIPCPDTLTSCTCSATAGNCTQTCCGRGNCKESVPEGCTKLYTSSDSGSLVCLAICDNEPPETTSSWCFEVLGLSTKHIAAKYHFWYPPKCLK